MRRDKLNQAHYWHWRAWAKSCASLKLIVLSVDHRPPFVNRTGKIRNWRIYTVPVQKLSAAIRSFLTRRFHTHLVPAG